MKYTVIADSCCNLFSRDLSSEKMDFHVAPLTLMVGGEEMVDEENLDTKVLVEKMRLAKEAAKTACPSPEAFADIMRDRDNIIVIALSSKLSGTYASAMVAAQMIKEKFPEKKLFVLDTLSACSGLDHILFRLKELIECGEYTFDQITVKIAEYASKVRVRFVLHDLSNLIKNGRMNKILGRILSTAKIKLVCGDDGKGEIKKYGMALSHRQALQKLAELPMSELEAGAVDGTPAFTTVTIAHVHNEEDASLIKRILESRFGFLKVKTLLTRGVSTIYAADKGICIAY